MLIERAVRRQGQHRLQALNGRRVLGFVRRHADQEWRNAEGTVIIQRLSVATQDRILSDAVRRERAQNVLRFRPQRSS